MSRDSRRHCHLLAYDPIGKAMDVFGALCLHFLRFLDTLRYRQIPQGQMVQGMRPLGSSLTSLRAGRSFLVTLDFNLNTLGFKIFTLLLQPHTYRLRPHQLRFRFD